MKKTTSIFLFFSLLVPLTGTYLWLYCEKAAVKQQVKQKILGGIDKEELISLTFKTKETTKILHWEHAREFEYQGRMYDVVETIEKGDSITYWCWPDHEETQLNRLRNEMAKTDTGKDIPVNNSLVRLLDLGKDICHLTTPEVNTDLQIEFSPRYFRHIFFPAFCLNTPPSPPPEIVV